MQRQIPCPSISDQRKGLSLSVKRELRLDLPAGIRGPVKRNEIHFNTQCRANPHQFNSFLIDQIGSGFSRARN